MDSEHTAVLRDNAVTSQNYGHTLHANEARTADANTLLIGWAIRARREIYSLEWTFWVDTTPLGVDRRLKCGGTFRWNAWTIQLSNCSRSPGLKPKVCKQMSLWIDSIETEAFLGSFIESIELYLAHELQRIVVSPENLIQFSEPTLALDLPHP